jgi:hypothetical protein
VYDTWAARDLPVLDATVGLLEQSYMVTVTDIAARTGLEAPVVAKALEALDPVYVDFRKTTTGGDPRFWYVFKVTPEARRAVGQWPTAESLASRLAEQLSAAARQETDGERQGLLTYAARLIGDTLRDATVLAAGQVLAPAFGGVPQPEMGEPLVEVPPEPEPDFRGLVPLPELAARSQGAVTGSAATAPEPAARPEAESGSAQEAGSDPEMGAQEQGPFARPAARPRPEETVPDLNPWPEPHEVSESEAAAQERHPLPQPTTFPQSLTGTRSADGSMTAGAAGDDPDSADTDLNVARSLGDAASTV